MAVIRSFENHQRHKINKRLFTKIFLLHFNNTFCTNSSVKRFLFFQRCTEMRLRTQNTRCLVLRSDESCVIMFR